MRLKGWTGPAALAAAVAGIVGGAVWIGGIGSSTGASGRPAMLHLAAASGGGVAAMAADAAGTKEGGTSGGYVLTGSLPDGQPDDQPVYRLNGATADDANTVARALGLDGTPTKVKDGWVLRDGKKRLAVRTNGSWSYGDDCAPDQPVAEESVDVACAYAVSSGVVEAKPPADAPATADPETPTSDDGNVAQDGSSGDGVCKDTTCTDAVCDKDGNNCSVEPAPAPEPPCAEPQPDTSGDSPNSGGGSGSSTGSTGSGSAGTSEGSTGASDPDACYPVEPSPIPMPAPVPVEPGPSDSDARAAAAPVFDALGLGDAAVTVWSGDPTSTVQASPKVDGIQTVGWVTSVQVDGKGDIQWADGWVNDAKSGDTYPLLTAQAAFDALKDMPRPMMEMCAVRKDGEPGCADMPPTEITGASLGLMLDYDGTDALLVPAWLFDIKGSTDPLPQLAVDPAYLAPPENAVDSGSGGGASSGNVDGGDSGPATSGVVDVPAVQDSTSPVKDGTQPTER